MSHDMLDYRSRAIRVELAIREALSNAEYVDDELGDIGDIIINDDEDVDILVYDGYARVVLDDMTITIPYGIVGDHVVVADPSEWDAEEDDVDDDDDDEQTSEGEDVSAENETEEASAMDVAAAPTSEVKALPGGVTSGYLIRFGSPEDDGDLSPWRDIFLPPPQTDYGTALKSDVYVHHRQLPGLGKRRLKHQAELSFDDVGVVIKHLLDLRDPYERALYELAQRGKLGWSSGTAPHLVERKRLDDGRHIITSWPLGIDASYTPTPAGGLAMTATAMKALIDEAIDALSSAVQSDATEETAAARKRALLLDLDLIEMEETP